MKKNFIRLLVWCSIWSLMIAGPFACRAEDRVLLDFNMRTRPPANWTVEGYAFGTRHPLLDERQRAAIATRNQRYVQTGRMTSPEFTVDSDYLHITCSGTFHPTRVAVALTVDGKDVRTCSPEPGYGFLGAKLPDISFFQPPDSAEYFFETRVLRGKLARIEVRDQHDDGLFFDVRVVATDESPPPGTNLIQDAASWKSDFFERRIDGDFLLVPVGPLAGTPLQPVTLEIDGEEKLVANLPIAIGAIEIVGYEAVYDLTMHEGKRLRVMFHSYSGRQGSAESAKILLQRKIPGREISDRTPAFHIYNRIGMLNDPNGLVYYNDQWHLFHQFNYNVSHLDWKHYVSTDLMHWEERPIALFHDSLGSMHSGSATVDVLNTSGWQDGSLLPLVLAYTASSGNGGPDNDQIQRQCIAYSTDGGRNFVKYVENPVLGRGQRFITPRPKDAHSRDPKVFWFSPTRGRDPNARDGHWVMVLFERTGHTIYTSPDLKTWTQTGSIEGFHECPELFPLAVDGNPKEVKWVMYGAAGRYHIGAFDGGSFQPETEKPIPMFYDGRCYASQTFNNTRAGWGGQPRRVQLAWQGGRLGQMSLPNELSLRTTPLGLRVCMLPVREIDNLYLRTKTFDELALTSGQTNPFVKLNGGLYDIEIEADLSKAKQFTLNLRGRRVTVNVDESGLSIGRTMKIPGTQTLFLRAVVDNTSQDIYFGQHGLFYSPGTTTPAADKSLGIEVGGGQAVFRKCRVRELKPIWH